MATKDISEIQVVQAYGEMKRQMDEARGSGQRFEYADDILLRTTRQPSKVCFRAMERACNRGLIAYGMWLHGGWLTDKGRALFTSND